VRLRVLLEWREIGVAITESREMDGPFISEYDLQRRVPSIRRTELRLLAKVGAFNWTGEKHHRRTALWRAERAGQSVGPLFENISDEHEIENSAPLLPMTTDERLVADFGGTGLMIGPHLMSFHRVDMIKAGVIPAGDLEAMSDGIYTRIAGVVIARQRPGTANGFIFLSLEDETGISNAIINPQLYERNRVAVTRGKILQIDGTLQNQDGVVSVKASVVRILDLSRVDVRSHDFH
jgi:error-prone DNA polymerase